jgi:peptidoglycan L-alanyl-D-glutamate endopeptidase CwlK
MPRLRRVSLSLTEGVLASRDLKDLVPDFRGPMTKLLDKLKKRGIEMRPYHTLRDPLEQARLWRQSRTAAEIEQQIARFRAAGAGFLAHCIEAAGPQHGDPVTNALPGLSWHQWGEAVDCMWVVDGRAKWSTQELVGGVNGYRVYAQEAQKLGLTPGGFFTKLKDWPHVQKRAAGSPTSLMTLAEIDAEMRERFGNTV